ncbi:hypothetical protein IWQ61_008172 [Dispira simplex]|nr:hypothetical protein IWQ61_008172 [Dispira simplex]
MASAAVKPGPHPPDDEPRTTTALSPPQSPGLTLEHVERFLQEDQGTPIAEANDLDASMLERYGPHTVEPLHSEPYPLPFPVVTSTTTLSVPPLVGNGRSETLLFGNNTIGTSGGDANSISSTTPSMQPLPTLAVPKQAKFRTTPSGFGSGSTESSVGGGPPSVALNAPVEGTVSKHAAMVTNTNNGQVDSTPDYLRINSTDTPTTPATLPRSNGHSRTLTPDHIRSHTYDMGDNRGRAFSSADGNLLPRTRSSSRRRLRNKSASATPNSGTWSSTESPENKLSGTPPDKSSVTLRPYTSISRRSSAVTDNGSRTSQEAGLITSQSQPSATSYGNDGNASLSAIFLKKNADFHMLFKEIPISELLAEDYGCALQRDILVQGRMYITESYVCFHANIFGWITHLVLQFSEIVSIEKRMTALIIPNAIQLNTLHARYFFASFIYRDAAYSQLVDLWARQHPGYHVGAMSTSSAVMTARTSGEVDKPTESDTKSMTSPDSNERSASSAKSQFSSGESYSSYDSDWSAGSSCTEDYTDVESDGTEEHSKVSHAERTPRAEETTVTATPADNRPSQELLPGGIWPTPLSATLRLAQTLQSLVQRTDDTRELKKPEDSPSLQVPDKPTPSTSPMYNNMSKSEAALGMSDLAADTQSSKEADVGVLPELRRSNSAWQTPQSNNGSPTEDTPETTPGQRKSVHRPIGYGASSVANVHTTHVMTGSNRSAMLTTSTGQEQASPSNSPPNQTTPPENDKVHPTPPESSTPKPSSPTQCPCLPANDHYDTLALDETYNCYLPVLYKLLFNGDVPDELLPTALAGGDAQIQFSQFMSDYMTSEAQGNRDLTMSAWRAMSGMPPYTTSTVYQCGIENRNIRYIRPINAPIGPKSATCDTTDICLYKNFSQAVVIDTTTFTPDVPSGSCFHTKARVCLMHAGDYKSRIIATHKVVWTKSSWIKGPVEKGSLEGNNQYFQGLNDWLRRFLREHPQFSSTPTSPAARVAEPQVTTHAVESTLPDGTPRRTRGQRRKESETADQNRRRHRRHRRREPTTASAAEGQTSRIQKSPTHVEGSTGTSGGGQSNQEANPVLQWLASWLPMMTPTQVERSVMSAPLPNKILSSAQAMSSRLDRITPADKSYSELASSDTGHARSGDIKKSKKGTTASSLNRRGAMKKANEAPGVVYPNRHPATRDATVIPGVLSYGTDFSYWLMSLVLCVGLAALVSVICLTWWELHSLSRHLAVLVDQQRQLLRLHQPTQE